MSLLLLMDIMFVYDLSVNHMAREDHASSHDNTVQSKFLPVEVCLIESLYNRAIFY